MLLVFFRIPVLLKMIHIFIKHGRFIFIRIAPKCYVLKQVRYVISRFKLNLVIE